MEIGRPEPIAEAPPFRRRTPLRGLVRQPFSESDPMHRSTLVRAMRAAGLAALATASLAPAAHAADASLLKVLNATPASANPQNLFEGNGLFFSADDGTHGQELWRSTGTGNATLVKDLFSGVYGSNPSGFLTVGDLTYFTAFGEESNQLYVTDGTAAGTRVLTGLGDVDEGNGFTASQVFVVGQTIFVSGTTGEGYDLYKYSPEGDKLTYVSPFNVESVATLPDALLYTSMFSGRLHSVNEAGQDTVLSTARNGTITVSDSKAYFAEYGPENESHLVVTDGETTEELLYDDDPINGIQVIAPRDGGGVIVQQGSRYYRALPDGAVSQIGNGPQANSTILSLGSRFAYIGYDGEDVGLFVNGGVGDDSDRLDLGPGGDYTVSGLVESDDQMYFIRRSGGQEVLWTSDGTDEGTYALTDGLPFAAGAGTFGPLVPVPGGGVSFSAKSTEVGNEAFTITAGTPDERGEPQLIKDINTVPGDGTVGAAHAIEFGNQALFSVNDGSTTQPWVTDGTADGTRSLNPGASGSQFLIESAAFGPLAMFISSSDSEDTTGVVRQTDGDGYFNVSETNGDGSHAHSLVVTAGRPFYLAYAPGAEGDFDDLYDGHGNPVNHPEAWPGNSSVKQLASAGGLLYVLLRADNGGEAGLWTLDPETLETTLVASSQASSTLEGAVDIGGKLYFQRTTQAEGREAWVTDGTPDGTEPLGDLSPGPSAGTGDSPDPIFSHAGATVFVSGADRSEAEADEDPGVKQFSRVTANGLTSVALPERPNGAGAITAGELRHLTSVGDLLYADVSDGLIRIDPAGDATLVGSFDYEGISDLREVGGKLYFSGQVDGDRELWTSDGTTAGTRVSDDIVPGGDYETPASSDPRSLFSLGTKVLFTASTKVTGRQLFSFDSATDTPPPVVTPTTPTTTPTDPENPGNPGEPETPPATTPAVQEPTGPQGGNPPAGNTGTPGTPAPAATGGPATENPPADVPDTRAVPRKVEVGVTNKTDTKAPYKYKLSGSLLGAKGLAKKSECTGSANIEISSSSKATGKTVVTVIKSYSTKLRWIDGECSFDKEITLPKKGLPKNGKVQATVFFKGTKNQQPKASKPITLRFG